MKIKKEREKEQNKRRLAHLAQPAQLHIDLNSAIHEQHQTHATLPRHWTHPAVAHHHELSTQQEMNSDPVMRGRRSREELEATQHFTTGEYCTSLEAPPQEIATETLYRSPARLPPSISAACARLGVCFFMWKLSQYVGRAYPSKRGGRPLLNA
jgi:hypothetical protein